nr:uncharacterized protein LOC111838379 isoform X1 [Paramormyrops kingsleyae]
MASFTRMGSDQPQGASREDSGVEPLESVSGRIQPTTSPARRIQFGPADNRDCFQAAFASACRGEWETRGGTTSPLAQITPLSPMLPTMLRTIDIPPFTAEAMESNQVDINGFVLASCLCSLRVQQQHQHRQQLIAEMLTLHFPQGRSLAKDEARAVLQGILSDVRNLNNQIWFADTLTELGTQEDGMDPKELAVLQYWNKSERTWAANITLGQQMSVLEIISKHLSDRARGRCLCPILMCLMSFALRGMISRPKLLRVQQELIQIMPNVADQLTHDDITLTWRNFGALLNNKNVASTFRRWLSYLPVPALLLRVVMARAAGSRLIRLDVVARAIHEHPTFPWHIAMRLYPDEWANAVSALRHVGDNPYYGYRGIEYVRSIRYKSVSWFCSRVLLIGGDKTLGTYAGFVVDRLQKDEHVENIIQSYFQGADLDTDPSPEEYASYRTLLELVRIHPANTGLFMNMEGHADPKTSGSGGDPTGPDDSGSYGSARGEAAPTSYDDLDLGRLKVDDDDESDSTPDASISTP